MTDPAEVRGRELEDALAVLVDGYLLRLTPVVHEQAARRASDILDEIARERCELGLCEHEPGECGERASESALTDGERNGGGV